MILSNANKKREFYLAQMSVLSSTSLATCLMVYALYDTNGSHEVAIAT